MTKAVHLVRPTDERTKLKTPSNGPGHTPSVLPRFTEPSSDKWCSYSTKKPYDGAELKPYEGRPDANDHKNFGSVVGGVWQPYKPPGLMCVGIAGPVPITGSQVRFSK